MTARKPIPVIVNKSGGTAAAKGRKLRGELIAAFEAAGQPIDLHLVEGSRVAKTAARFADHPIVVVGGGDGTLGSAAQALADHGKAVLGILPLGTRNHLARELGIPLDLGEAAQVIAARHKRRIDLARVNGQVFVNNASIGFYPRMVNERDAIDLPKKLASIPAAFAALRRMRHHRLRLSMPGTGAETVTPMLFVGNNRYRLELGKLGKRDALDDGVLSVFAIASRHRWALVGMALRAVIGRADPDKDFAAIGEVNELTVGGRSRSIHVALDGEVRRLVMPLHFTIEANGLSVIAPA